MTRAVKDFFEGFGISRKLTVEIEVHPQTEFLLNVQAPAPIIKRRQTIAGDESVQMQRNIEPNAGVNAYTQTEFVINPAKLMSIIARRRAHAERTESPIFEGKAPAQIRARRNTIATSAQRNVFYKEPNDSRRNTVAAPALVKSEYQELSDLTGESEISRKPTDGIIVHTQPEFVINQTARRQTHGADEMSEMPIIEKQIQAGIRKRRNTIAASSLGNGSYKEPNDFFDGLRMPEEVNAATRIRARLNTTAVPELTSVDHQVSNVLNPLPKRKPLHERPIPNLISLRDITNRPQTVKK